MPEPRERHESCVHYQLIGGLTVQVEKGALYDYCTDDKDDTDA
jgi:hypothetical protein